MVRIPSVGSSTQPRPERHRLTGACNYELTITSTTGLNALPRLPPEFPPLCVHLILFVICEVMVPRCVPDPLKPLSGPPLIGRAGSGSTVWIVAVFPRQRPSICHPIQPLSLSLPNIPTRHTPKGRARQLDRTASHPETVPKAISHRSTVSAASPIAYHCPSTAHRRLDASTPRRPPMRAKPISP